jgi:tetratricopeptide (TPR) repeat protein
MKSLHGGIQMAVIAVVVVLMSGCHRDSSPRGLEKLVLAGNWSQVEKVAADWMKDLPQCRSEANVLMGYAALERGDTAAAGIYFLRVNMGKHDCPDSNWFANLSSHHPDNPSAQLLWADALARQGDRKSALGHLDQALSLNPNLASARAAKATLKAIAGQKQEALPFIEPLVPDSRFAAEALTIRGLLRMEDGNSSDALQDFNQALQYAPRHGIAYNARGVFYARCGMLRESAADFEKAFQLTPELTQARKNWIIVQRAAARASAISSKLTIYVTDFGINNWTRSQKMFDDFANAKSGSVVPNLPKNGQILIPMPERMPQTEIDKRALVHQIADGIVNRVRQGNLPEFEVRLVQHINALGYVTPWQQGQVKEFGKIVYEALGIAKDNLSRQGRLVNMPAIVGSNGGYVLTETLPKIRTQPFDSVTCVDCRAYRGPTKDTFNLLHGKLSIINISGDIPAGMNMIGNSAVSQALHKELPNLKVYWVNSTKNPFDVIMTKHLETMKPLIEVNVKEYRAEGYTKPTRMTAFDLLNRALGVDKIQRPGAVGMGIIPETRGGISLGNAEMTRNSDGSVRFVSQDSGSGEPVAVYSLFPSSSNRESKRNGSTE